MTQPAGAPVPCPTCKAAAGSRCRALTGPPRTVRTHAAREVARRAQAAPTSPCGHTNASPTMTWVCIAPDHGWASRSGSQVADHRRRAGKIVPPDRHVYVRAS